MCCAGQAAGRGGGGRPLAETGRGAAQEAQGGGAREVHGLIAPPPFFPTYCPWGHSTRFPPHFLSEWEWVCSQPAANNAVRRSGGAHIHSGPTCLPICLVTVPMYHLSRLAHLPAVARAARRAGGASGGPGGRGGQHRSRGRGQPGQQEARAASHREQGERKGPGLKNKKLRENLTASCHEIESCLC
jgi:hypothetical protein